MFLGLAHDRRRILHFNVTGHPTTEWAAQQLRDAFPWDTARHYLLRDRDKIFGDEFTCQVHNLGIQEVLSTPRSPWRRAYVERVIGSIRCECQDDVLVFGETSLRRTLRGYSTTITGRGLICQWPKTRETRGPCSRQSWDQSWRFRSSAVYITGTNAAPPEMQ